MTRTNAKKKIQRYYDAVASGYHEQYDPRKLRTAAEYPANHFRLQLLLKSFRKRGVRRVVEVGVGEGTPLSKLAEAGLDTWGFDITPRMVELAKKNMEKVGVDPKRVFLGDIQKPATLKPLRGGGFDALLAMGVMPHVTSDEVALKNMRSLVRPGGTVFIEFRNTLFSLFTFNRYTAEFILDDLLKGVSAPVKKVVARELKDRVRMDLPPRRDFDAILSKFHNPLEMPALFEKLGFGQVRLLWYHYHPAMPYLEGKVGRAFREAAFKLEGEPSGWRGMFLCSAFVVEAVRER